MKSRIQVAELAALLASREGSLWINKVAIVAMDTLAICRVATSCKNAAVQLCKGQISQELFDKKQGRALAKLVDRGKPYHVMFTASDDPRGCCLHMHSTDPNQPIHGNTLDGDEDGYGI